MKIAALRSRLAHGLMTSVVFTVVACDSSGAVAPSANEPSNTTPAAPTTTNTTPTPAPSTPATPGAPAPTPPAASTSSPFAGSSIFAEDDTPAARQAATWRTSRPGDASMMDVIAKQPVANWVNGGTDPKSQVSNIVTRAMASGAMAVIVAYNIPNRDCGLYSAGGEASANAYKTWIRQVASGIGGRKAAIILEPDALAGMTCLAAPLQAERVMLLKDAVQTLKAAGATVYIDAGNAKWVPAAEMAARLQQVGVDIADGFALNVSNFLTNSENYTYGDAVSSRIGGKHYVIDTSRNGNGGTADDQWCNPGGRAIGVAPTANVSHANVDALLWIKYPGESDGACNGGPNAGIWWADYALGLVKTATSMVASSGN